MNRLRRRLSGERGWLRIPALLALFLLPLLLAACLGRNAVLDQPPLSTSSVGTTAEASGTATAPPAQTADDAAGIVLEELSGRRLGEIYERLSPASRERYSREDVVKRFADIHASLNTREICYGAAQRDPETSSDEQIFYTTTVRYTLPEGLLERPFRFSLLYNAENERWEVEWTPDCILPGLGQDGRIQTEILPAHRGSIYDRAGYPLATNIPLLEISVDSSSFDREKIPEVNQLLGLPEKQIAKALQQEWVGEHTRVPIATLTDTSLVDEENFARLGLQWGLREGRSYPFAEATAQLIGYLAHPDAQTVASTPGLDASEWVGKSGLEALYDSRLRGQSGYRRYISGHFEESLVKKPAVPGEDLHLTIDALATRDLYQRYQDQDLTMSAIDPQTGDIVILLSTPSYDPQAFLEGMATDAYRSLLEDPRLPLQAKYAFALSPGSTQKVLSSVIALSEDPLLLEKQMWISGETWQKDASWGNYYVHRYQELDQDFSLADALVHSDNIFFARLITDLGAAAFNRGMQALGIGLAPSPDYPFAPGQVANAGSLAEDASILLADSAYGQGELLLSPLQLCRIYAALLNGGRLYPTRLLHDAEPLLDAQAFLADQPEGEALPLSQTARDYLAGALEQVAEQTYGRSFADARLQFAGKSGTAELGQNAAGEMQINSWFVGYTRNAPSLLLALTVFDSQNYDDSYTERLFRDAFRVLGRGRPYRLPAYQTEGREVSAIPSFRRWTEAPVETLEPRREQAGESDTEQDAEGSDSRELDEE